MPDQEIVLLIERLSPLAFNLTVERLSQAIADAGMRTFAFIDHAGNVKEAGLSMPASTVLTYGKGAGGTPIMLAYPRAAIDFPLHVLVREDSDGQTTISLYPIAARLEASGVPSALAALLAPGE